MADTLNTNPIVIDLTDATSRDILARVRHVYINSVYLVGTKPAAATTLKLIDESVVAPFWFWRNDTITADTILGEDWWIGVSADGIRLETTGGNWGANSFLFIYLA